MSRSINAATVPELLEGANERSLARFDPSNPEGNVPRATITVAFAVLAIIHHTLPDLHREPPRITVLLVNLLETISFQPFLPFLPLFSASRLSSSYLVKFLSPLPLSLLFSPPSSEPWTLEKRGRVKKREKEGMTIKNRRKDRLNGKTGSTIS